MEGSFSASSKPILATKYSFCSIFRDLQSPLSGEKKVQALFFSRKKIHLAESCGCGALAANVGPPGRPWGYQRLTLGQPSVNLGSTLGQPSVSSLAISGRFWPILPVMSISTEDKRTCICKMVDFPIRKRDFRVRTWSGAFWEPLERKKEKTKCIYSRPYRAKKKCTHFSSPEKKIHLAEIKGGRFCG